MNILQRFLRIWLACVLPRPRLVLGLAFATALASVIAGALILDVETDQLELISPDHPLIELTDRIEPFDFGGKRTLTVIVEAPSPYRVVSFVEALVERIEDDPEHFKDVWYRVDPNPLKRWALFYLDRESLLHMRRNLDEYSSFIQGAAASPTLLGFFKLVNQEMASRLVGELFTGFLDEQVSEQRDGDTDKPMEIDFLISTLEGLNSYLHGSPEYRSPWSSFLGGEHLDLNLEGYFWEADKRFAFLRVLPQKSQDGFDTSRNSIVELRRLMDEVRSTHPDVMAGVTGEEALNTDEMTTVLDDMARATWLSLLGVLLLMILFFRGFRRPLVETISLSVGICWTVGFTALFIGHLNILSVVFGPLLCGLGVDYGIHWFARIEEEERKGLRDPYLLVRRVMERSGPGILTAGLGAAFSFLPFILTGFKGLVELGIITGVGTFLLLIADFTVLPALSVVLSARAAESRLQRSHSSEADKAKGTVEQAAAFGSLEVVRAPATAARATKFVEHTTRAELEEEDLLRLNPRSARWVLAVAAAVSILAAWSASGVYFDLNPLRLQAANAESVVWEKRLIDSSKRSVLSAAAFAHSPEEVLAKVGRFRGLRSVSEVETVFTFLPDAQEEKLPLIRSLGGDIPEIHPQVLAEGPPNVEDLIDVLQRIQFKMRDDEAEKWGAQQVTVEQMARVRELVTRVVRTLLDSPEAVERLSLYRERFQRDLVDTWGAIKESVVSPPMRIDDIPEVLRDRYLNEGTYLIRIYPRESIWEQGALSRFVREVQGVDPLVVGDPISLHVFASAYKRACLMASLYAVVAIVFLLFVTFRRLSLILLALVPLAVGTLWTLGIMGLFGIPFNLANSIFMPLVVGAGVEYGVIILHRWNEGRMRPGHLPASTAKGVILAALTTTVGFGTLMISHHQGIFSLGFVAWAGSLCVLLSAVLLLPALLARMVEAGFVNQGEEETECVLEAH